MVNVYEPCSYTNMNITFSTTVICDIIKISANAAIP